MLRVLLLLYLLFSAAYLVMMAFLPLPGAFIVKSIPALLLAASVLLYLPGRERYSLFAGFVFSAGGDAVLSFYRDLQIEILFIAGLGLFLVAHICYIITYLMKLKWNPQRLIVGVALVIFSIVMSVMLAPKLGPLQIPVFAYIGVITVMGVLSTQRAGVAPGLIAGAILFILSDALIAVNQFLYPFQGSGYAIMITYYIGQLLIACAFLYPPRGVRE